MPALHPDFSDAGGYGIPFNVVGASTPRSTVSVPVRRRVRPRRLPDPGLAEHRGRQRPPHPDDRHERLPPLRAVRGVEESAAAGRPVRARRGTSARTPCGPTAGRAPTRPACRSSRVSSAIPRSPPASSTTRSASRRRRPARATSTRRATRPATDRATRCRRWASGSGSRRRSTSSGFGPQSQVDPDGAQAVRDAPRRQRLAVVHHRRPRWRLGRRRAPPTSARSTGATSRSSTRPASSTGDAACAGPGWSWRRARRTGAGSRSTGQRSARHFPRMAGRPEPGCTTRPGSCEPSLPGQIVSPGRLGQVWRRPDGSAAPSGPRPEHESS